MLQRIYSALLFSLLSVSLAFGQGSISGTVKDSKTGEAVIGANVIIQGTTIGAPTDVEGKFLISNVKAGTYALQISSVTYKAHTVPDVIVEDAKRINIDVQVSEDVSTLEEVVVTGTRQTDTDFELLRSIKENKLIVVGVSAQQIARSLDRDAAQVIRRVPGVTIRGDQFIQVRGLSERYNPVMLHNAYAPSMETDVRSFSFAIIPSSQLDRILVFKSPAADIPGDFAGGAVKIFTKGIPDENGLVIDYSTQVRAGTTFNDYYSQQKGSAHFTGFNTGYYDLPSSFPADLNKIGNSDALVSAGRSLKNIWVPQKSTAIPDQRLNITFNRKFNLGKVQVGNVTALNYSNSYAIYDVQRADYTTTAGGGQAQNFGYADVQYNQQIRTGALFNWAFKFNPKHIIELKNLYNQGSNDQYVDRNGTGVSEGQKNIAFDKTYRGIYSGQLLGTHQLFKDKTTVEWMAGYNNSYRNQPDYKRYRSQSVGNDQYQLIIPYTPTPDLLGRFYSKLNEDAITGSLSVKQTIVINDNPLQSPELKAGVFYESKNRTFNARNIGYTLASSTLNPSLTYAPASVLFEPQNINNTDGIMIGEITYGKNSYTASNDLLAYYLMTSLPITKKLKLDAGVRQENNLQKLNSYDDFVPVKVNVNNQVNRLLPSANLSYNFTEKMLVRGAYGETLNRPEFRELAPFSFFDFNFNFLYNGNPELKTAKIQNFDLRWELYPSKTELITFGAFYKYFTNPIEVTVEVNSGSGVKNVFFNNSQYARDFGVEVEVKKSLDGVTGSQFLNNINLLFNATLIKSEVKINDAFTAGRESSRPLQGQAPYTINAGIFYTSDPSGWQVNLLYNVVGKNIVFVGNESYPDVYLMPRHIVDLTFNKQLGERFNLKGGISDILNQRNQLLQDGNGDGKLDNKKDVNVQSFRPGQVFSVGFSYKLW